MAQSTVTPRAERFEYLRPPRPIHFPEFELVSEGKRHLELRTFLYQLLQHLLGPAHSVGSDQFVYWNARDARRKLSPDVFVHLGRPDEPFGSWKTWERGTPALGVEIVSPSEDAEEDWDDKLERYHECGIAEVVRFDPEAPEGTRLRVWDRVDDDLVERRVAGDATSCRALGFRWVVAPIDACPVALRLADAAGNVLPNALETERAERVKERAASEVRIRELEKALSAARTGGGR